MVDQQTLILRIFYDLETSFVLTVERGRRDRDAEIDTLRERECFERQIVRKVEKTHTQRERECECIGKDTERLCL